MPTMRSLTDTMLKNKKSYQYWIKHHPLDDDGIAHIRMKRLEVEAVKL